MALIWVGEREGCLESRAGEAAADRRGDQNDRQEGQCRSGPVVERANLETAMP